MAELVLRFVLIGAIAFGGGQAALPLVEQLTVSDTGWLTPEQFSVGIGLAYATPGPVLILASYVGYHVAGFAGALAATVAVFAIPVALAATAARVVARLSGSERFRRFGRFAGAAAVGLLGITLFAVARPVIQIHPALLIASAAVFAAEGKGTSPIFLLVAAAIVGGITGEIAG
jgi:chromate transporter